MNYLPNDFSFPVSLGIFGMKLPFKKHQLNLQTSTGPSWCLFPYYFSLCERILRRIRQRCRLVVIDVLHRNPNILKYLKQSLSVMSECNRSVMRIILLDQNVTVETSHLMNGKYANASERTGCNRKDFSLCHILSPGAISPSRVPFVTSTGRLLAMIIWFFISQDASFFEQVLPQWNPINVSLCV